MKRLFALSSIHGRLTLASLTVLPLICGALGWSLVQAFSTSLLDSQERQMTLQAYALMATAELQGESLWLPELMADDRLNQITSQTYALVLDGQQRVLWRSLSAPNPLPAATFSGMTSKPGEHRFEQLSLSHQPFFIFQYAVEWEAGDGARFPFQFVLVESQADYQAQVDDYRNTLWLWLALITVSLLLLQFIILSWGLRPVSQLIEDLGVVRSGREGRLKGDYPEELRAMASSVNDLLEHEEKQRERYRNTLSNLAHSIKNPVAIITSELGNAVRNPQIPRALLDELIEQNERINQLVSYQLNRAVGAAAAPFSKAIPVAPVGEKVISALQKVYVAKDPQVRCDIAPEQIFRGDDGDLMELLGNLLDNAFKYGHQQIHILAEGDASSLSICIEDDGPGLDDAQKQALIRRGARADTTVSGQGIGLAVVSDIVESYRGTLKLEDSGLGGLRVRVAFSWVSRH